MTDKEAMKMATALKTYCQSQECEDCVFDGVRCKLDVPLSWDLEVEKKPTEAEIAIAIYHYQTGIDQELFGREVLQHAKTALWALTKAKEEMDREAEEGKQ